MRVMPAMKLERMTLLTLKDLIVKPIKYSPVGFQALPRDGTNSDFSYFIGGPLKAVPVMRQHRLTSSLIALIIPSLLIILHQDPRLMS